MDTPLLLEVGTEEIPAGFMAPAFERLEQAALNLFEAARLPVAANSLQVTGTPRRLVLGAGLAERQRDAVSTVIGPSRRVAYAADGSPTKAAEGFARSQGVELAELRVTTTEKGEYLCVERRQHGEATMTVLPGLLAQLLLEVPFPKSMRWGEGSLRFARPVRWLVALFGDRLVEFELDGVRSGRRTYGHRFLAPEPFDLASADFSVYCAALRQRHVMVRHDERRAAVQQQLTTAAADLGGSLHEHQDLLETVIHLVEAPRVVSGSFDPAYLGLPPEVLITTMATHQKYFPVDDPAAGLKPNFLAVSNMPIDNLSHIRAGNERVLAARLADAKFFFDEDRKTRLEDLVEQLRTVIYQERLGTSYAKVQRNEQLATHLARCLAPEAEAVCRRIARLCKGDLVSHMVGEFPELQGIMGREYALLQGESREVCQGIYEHYLPRFAGDSLPTAAPGAIVGIADKLDAIVGCFSIGLLPSGSEDPLALRRQAAAIAAIILHHRFELDLGAAVGEAARVLAEQRATAGEAAGLRPRAEVEAEVREFFKGRMQTLLVNRGYTSAVVEAVLARQAREIVDADERCAALETLRGSDEFQALLTLVKRTSNILGDFPGGTIAADLLQEAAERRLAEEFEAARGAVLAFVAQRAYAAALSRLVGLKEALDNFFDNVLVMCENESLRTNRLRLLRGLADLFSPLADFSRLAAG